MQKICFALLMLMIAALSPAWAEDVSVQASVSAAKVSLKEVVQLRLTVNGSKDALGPVNLPTIDGFDVRYLGPSTNISIVNGDYHSERSFIYNLFPTKAGHLQVPAITIDVNGKSYATKPVDVEVVNGPSGNAEAQPDQNAAPTVESLKDKIFLAVNVPVTDVYVNERVPLTIKLFVREIPIRDIQMPKLEAEGFSLDSYQQPKQYAQVVNGLRYEVVEFKVFLYPNRLGAVNVGPAQVEGNLLYKTDRHNPFTGSALDDDFFSGIFNSYSTRPVTVSAAPLTLHVSPLPEPQPEGFSGAVGLFDFTAGVTPPEVKVGDPLTLRMTVSGSGNWKNWHMPVFSDSHFKTYDPQIKDDANTRTLEQVIIPTQEGTTEVPATHFIYFDPSAKEYKTLTQGPFAVQVSKADPGQEFKAVGFNDMSQQPTLAAPVKVDIMASLQESVSKIWLWCLDLLKNPLFWFGFILVLFIGGGLFMWQKQQHRLANDTSFARRHHALKQARKNLDEVKDRLYAINAKEFYALSYKALVNYLADRTSKPAAALTVSDIKQILADHKVDEASIKSVGQLLETCDLVRFGGLKPNETQMQADYAQLKQLFETLPKSFK